MICVCCNTQRLGRLIKREFPRGTVSLDPADDQLSLATVLIVDERHPQAARLCAAADTLGVPQISIVQSYEDRESRRTGGHYDSFVLSTVDPVLVAARANAAIRERLQQASSAA